MKKRFSLKNNKSGYLETYPKPTQEELDKFYADQYFKDGVTTTYHTNYTEQEIKQKLLRAKATIFFIQNNLNSKNIIALELGSGEGYLLNVGIENNWDITGVDYQKEPVKKLNPSAIKNFVEGKPDGFIIEAIKNKKLYDVIVLQNVLEHVLNPKRLIDDAKKILNDDGVIFFQVPNDHSAIQALAKQEDLTTSDYWFLPPQHLNYFNDENIYEFCQTVGLEIIDGISDFPIEMYLWGNSSNYTKDSSLGKYAHQARLDLDLLFSRKGISAYVDFYRSAWKIGLGRNLGVLVRKT